MKEDQSGPGSRFGAVQAGNLGGWFMSEVCRLQMDTFSWPHRHFILWRRAQLEEGQGRASCLYPKPEPYETISIFLSRGRMLVTVRQGGSVP